MHIEINAGGLGAGIAVAEYQLNMAGFISDAEDVISSFKAVTARTYDLSGGVGTLQDAVEEINARIRREEDRFRAAQDVRQKSNDFLELAIRVDRQVAELVELNQEEFYRVNPWLRPPEAEDSPWYEDAWNWLCATGEAVQEGAEALKDWAADTLKNAWNGLVEFYNEHKKIIDTVLIVVGAITAIVAVIATGGLALAPLLGALGISASVAAAISTAVAVVAVVSTVGASVLNVVDVWCEIDDPVFNAWQTGLNITSTITNLAYSIGNIYNTFKKIDPVQYAQQASANKPYTNVKQLKPNEIQALNDYSGSNYRNINDSLRGLDTPTPENAETIRIMRETLGKSSLTDDMTLYRGSSTVELGDLMDLAPEELIGKSYTQPGFMSTSSDAFEAQKFMKNMHVTINAPAGSHGLNIAPISKLPWEAEYLFDIGQQLLITDAKMVDGILHLIVDLF